VILLAATTPLAVAACGASGPATAAEVCDSFTELADELTKINGFIDNGVFSKAGKLGKVAVRYEESTPVMVAGEALKEIADRDEVSLGTLDDAAQPIANLCGQSSLISSSARRTFGLD